MGNTGDPHHGTASTRGKVIDGSKIRTFHDLLKVVDEKDLKHLAADISKLADRTRKFAQEYYDRY